MGEQLCVVPVHSRNLRGVFPLRPARLLHQRIVVCSTLAPILTIWHAAFRYLEALGMLFEQARVFVLIQPGGLLMLRTF